MTSVFLRNVITIRFSYVVTLFVPVRVLWRRPRINAKQLLAANVKRVVGMYTRWSEISNNDDYFSSKHAR